MRDLKLSHTHNHRKKLIYQRDLSIMICLKEQVMSRIVPLIVTHAIKYDFSIKK